MAEIRVQTGWGGELASEAHSCLQQVREASAILESLNLDKALMAEGNIRNTYQKLQSYLEKTENRIRKMNKFLEPSMQQYEQLERKLLLEAQNLGAGILPANISSAEHLRKMFAGFNPE